MAEKVDVLDLIITTLKDHEKRMDEITERLEHAISKLEGPIKPEDLITMTEKAFLIGMLYKRITEDPTCDTAKRLQDRLTNSLPYPFQQFAGGPPTDKKDQVPT